MSDDRELVELLAAIDATPRASWVAGLRADLDAAWEIEDARYLDSLRTTTVTLVDHEPTQPTGGRRWPILITAAAAVVAVVGVAAIAINRMNSEDDEEPAPAAATTVAPTTVAPITVAPSLPWDGRQEDGEAEGFFAGDDGIPVTFTVPQGWFAPYDWLVHNVTPPGVRESPGVAFMEVTNIYADPCESESYVPQDSLLVDPPVGPTVDDLVAAFANLPDFAATAAVDVTVDGYAGKQIEFTVPDSYAAECSGKGALLYAGDAYFLDMEGRNQHNQLWILDVDGTRVVIDAYSFPNTSPQDRAALEKVLASIQIG